MKAMRRGPFGTGILFAFFLLIIVLVGCEKGTLGVKGGSISGTILDSRTLVGLSNVTVTAVTGDGTEKDSKMVTSDSRGSYLFNDLITGEWTLSFDKYGYSQIAADASASVKVVVVNNENRQAPEVRMTQVIANQYITVRGTLKDARSGTPIVLGTAQYSFGTNPVLSNRLPTELQTGLSFPAVEGEVEFRISVTNYKPYTVTLPSGLADIEMGAISLEPQSYGIVGIWKDVPGWVFTNNARADVIAYAGNRIVATTTCTLNEQTFTLSGIPIGVSVTLEAQILGYRMNGPIPVTPSGDFQGVIYQPVSLKNNFAQIYRDVRVILVGGGISNNDRVGAYCVETGTRWPETLVSGGILTAPAVVDLGTNQVPTGYKLTFTGYNVNDGTTGSADPVINDDGTDAQVVFIEVN